MKFANPEIEVLRFSSEDVIATSGAPVVTGLFYIPSSQYSGGSFGTDYVAFNGNIGAYDAGAGGYKIDNIYGAYGDTDDERELLVSGGGSMLGVTIPGSFWNNLAQQSYDAYSYNGNYYTNGVNYYTTYYSN